MLRIGGDLIAGRGAVCSYLLCFKSRERECSDLLMCIGMSFVGERAPVRLVCSTSVAGWARTETPLEENELLLSLTHRLM